MVIQIKNHRGSLGQCGDIWGRDREVVRIIKETIAYQGVQTEKVNHNLEKNQLIRLTKSLSANWFGFQ